ncbi:MAG: putative transrane protein [Actinomycetia bacterium]|nr:putative transrane protein [Actinomycetes bacterium]
MSDTAVLVPEVAVAVPPPTFAVVAPPGDPAILGLPIFAAGSVALGLALVGYVPAAAVGSVVPIVLAATGLGLLIATIWSASVGQTMVAGVFGLFAGFWLSYAVLLLGLTHNWFAIPAANVNRSIELFLITWAVVMFTLTVASVRLPLAYTLVFALVVVALVLLILGTANGDSTLNKAAGYVALGFGALGLYLFLATASIATGGGGYPLGRPIVR